MIEQCQERARQELLCLMEELAKRSWFGRWEGPVHLLLWRMAHGGSAEGWLEECRSSDEELRQLRELSERAGGWWHRSTMLEYVEGETGTKVFIPLVFWRWHYPFALIAMRFAIYLALLLDVLTALFIVPIVPSATESWSPFVTWPLGILVGLVGFFVLRWFEPWRWFVMLLLSPILWLTTGCRKLLP